MQKLVGDLDVSLRGPRLFSVRNDEVQCGSYLGEVDIVGFAAKCVRCISQPNARSYSAE